MSRVDGIKRNDIEEKGADKDEKIGDDEKQKK